MKNVVIDFIDTLKDLKTTQDLDRAFSKAVEALGFHRYAYQLSRAPGYVADKPIILSTYPEEWVGYYIESQYQTIDPVVIESPKQLQPFQWSSLTAGKELTKKQKHFFYEADDYGVANGIGIPIHGVNNAFSIVSLVADIDNKELAKILAEKEETLHILSLYYHQTAKDLLWSKKLLSSNDNQSVQDLTEREKECLRWVAQGKTAWEISRILAISERTVIFHIQNAKHKLNVTGRNHAVVKAIMLNII